MMTKMEEQEEDINNNRGIFQGDCHPFSSA
jgi:hypothetical protein